MKYKFLEHTADVKFQAFGKTLEESFSNASLALVETITKNVKIKPIVRKKITIAVEGRGPEGLLYDFLEEFLFLLDAENFLLSKINKIEIEEKSGRYELVAEASGDLASKYKFSNDVKAITYNEMFVKKEKNKFICQVVLDV